jgi:hypothetical protein
MPSFLALIVHAVGVGKHLLRDFAHRRVFVAGLAQLDEHGVLGETAHVHDEGLAVRLSSSAQPRMLAIETGCPPPVLLVTVSMPKGMRWPRAQHRLQPRQVDIALEGVDQRRLQALGNDQVLRFHAQVFQVGARGVEVAVVGHQVAALAHGGEQHLLGRAALVRGHEVLHAGDALHHRFQPVEAARAGVALVAFHDGAPLAARTWRRCRNRSASRSARLRRAA